MGTIGNTNAAPEYDYVNKGNNTSPYPFVRITTNNAGEAWLIVGVDSSYQGVTTVYFTYVGVVLSTS
jgi:hypothetical protein